MAHLVTGSNGNGVTCYLVVVVVVDDMQCVTHSHAYSGLPVAGNYIEFFRQKLQRNELVLRDELKLLLHLCQSAEDMVIARDAMFRYRPRSVPLKCRVCELSFKTVGGKCLRSIRSTALLKMIIVFTCAHKVSLGEPQSGARGL